tara:strand:+ start:8831 stop:10996 length:2166 start_codon:yes stop_codon:yes gene_type:complete
MIKKLFICEKPSQASDISRVLGATQKREGFIEGDGVIVTWCLGHLLEAAKPDYYCKELKPWRIEKLPVIPKDWHMEPVARVKKQLTVVKKMIKSANHVVIATDADREGELIARELMTYCKYEGKVERLWLSALDDASIQKALKTIKPGNETENLYFAGLSRQRADWIVGMNMTMATSCLFGKFGEGVLSVGRVQTPTLQLIVTRDRTIEQFKPQDYFEMFVNFIDEGKAGAWLKWNIPESLQNDETGRCLDKAAVSDVANKIHDKPAKITNLTKVKKKQAPPLPFSLSELQKKASALYGYTATKTLSIAQELYEKHKAITYPRTDSGYLPLSQHGESSVVLDSLLKIDPSLSILVKKCDVAFKSTAWNDKKVTAHHGIIPTTNQDIKLSSMSTEACEIYDLIRTAYISQFLGDFVYEQTKIVVACENEDFSATGRIPLILGWKNMSDNDETIDMAKEESEAGQDFPDWTEGQTLCSDQEKVTDKKTKAPAQFTEGTLIGAMESIGRYVEDPSLKKVLRETSGIGTQATRAAIIETLINREYIARDKKKLISTEKGRALIDLLPDAVKDPATTARWEQDLDDMAAGSMAKELFLANQNDNLSKMLEALKSGYSKQDPSLQNRKAALSEHQCPACDKPMVRRKPKSKNSYFWGCSGYPECTTTLPDADGKPGERKAAAKKTDQHCFKCDTGYFVERKSARGTFFGCSNYPKCKNVVQEVKVPQ